MVCFDCKNEVHSWFDLMAHTGYSLYELFQAERMQTAKEHADRQFPGEQHSGKPPSEKQCKSSRSRIENHGILKFKLRIHCSI